MRALTSKDGDLLSQFDNINEGNRNAIFDSFSLKKMLSYNHDLAHKGKIKRQIPLEHIFGFCKSFRKITRNLGFHITFKTASLQDIIYKSIAKNINVTINSLYLYVPFYIPSTETLFMFNESFQTNFILSYDDWYSERRLVTDTVYLVDIGSAQSVNSPKYLIAAR